MIRSLLETVAELAESSSTILPTDLWRPLLLSLLAGLSTSLGALVAIIHMPNHATMAVFLGIAIGVMVTVSMVELVIKNAMEHNALLVLASAAMGAVAYYLLEPLIPGKSDNHHNHNHGWMAMDKKYKEGGSPDAKSSAGGAWKEDEPSNSSAAATSATKDVIEVEEAVKYLRLGLLMALTMTLHNLPEGFAVAFSAFTPLGPIMAFAIAMHNIPEGIIIAAPIYAATGSRWAAVGLATLSGLSEPLGAAIALLALRPILTVERLQYVLAGTGGLMLAVSVLELWPEGKRCKNDRGLFAGILIGTSIMAFTLFEERVNGEV